jgi:hypothetical protein
MEYSNQKNAIQIDNSDRRHLIESVDAHRKDPLEPRNDDYYRALYGKDGVGGLIRDRAALAAVAWEFKHRDLKGYSGGGRAPWTQAKSDMLLASASELERWMVEHADEEPFNLTLVTIEEVMEAIPDDVKPTRGVRQIVGDALKRRFRGENLGKVRFGGRGGRQPRLWAINRADAKVSWCGRKDAELAEIYRREHPSPTAPAKVEQAVAEFDSLDAAE